MIIERANNHGAVQIKAGGVLAFKHLSLSLSLFLAGINFSAPPWSSSL
jgi:hypothetical protein